MNYCTTQIGLLLAIFGLVHVPALHAQTRYTWNGGSGSWDEPTNWTPNGVPAAADTAVVTAGFANLDTTATVAGFEFTGGHVDGSGDLTITDAMTWRNGKWRGSVTARVATGATLLITGAGNFNVDDDATFVNEGEGLWESPKTLSTNGAGDAQLVNEGTLELSFDATGGSHCAFVEFVNASGGLIRRTGSGVTNVSCPLTNDGTFRLEAGKLGLNRAGTDAGDWIVEAGATFRTINNTQTIAASGSITGEGTVDLQGGRLDVDGEATIGTLELGAPLGGNGPVTVTDVLDLQGGPMRDGGMTTLAPGATATLDGINLSLGNARTLRIEGTLAWSGASTISGTDETMLVNAGTMTSTGPGNRSFFGGTFRNEATFVHDGDALNFSGALLDNASTVRLDGGAMQINSHNSTFGGRYEITDGATLRTINGAITFPDSAVITGTGTVDFSGGTVTNAATWQPGLSPGVLSVGSNYYFDDSVLEIELGGPAPGIDFDQLAVAGVTTLGGTLRVTLTDSFVPADGDRFLVIPAASVTGMFDVLDLPDGLEAFVEITAEGVELVIGSIVIPVELTTFKTAVDGDAVVLTWHTASETINAGFQIQRRNTTRETPLAWHDVAFVEGAGTTAEAQTYRFTDRTLPHTARAVVYRLKQIDLDGAATYSEEVEVQIAAPEAFALHAPYPNPSAGQTTIAFDVAEASPVRFTVFDALGREVAVLVDGAHAPGRYEAPIDAATLPSGLYIYRIEAGHFTATRRMLLVK